MRGKKLFNLLVIGGSTLGLELACGDLDNGPLPDTAQVVESDKGVSKLADGGKPAWLDGSQPLIVDSRVGSDSFFDASVPAELGTVDAGVDSSGELANCGFCPNTLCCETGQGGEPKVKAGFECCWGTSC
jgi:hypothetical protein